MDEHIASLLDIAHRIHSAGKKLEELHLAQAMVLSLPKTPSWELVKILLFKMRTFTSELVSTKLLQEANCQVREKSESGTALVIRDKLKRKPKKGKAQLTDECHKCHKKGHWARDCPDSDEKQLGGSANLTVQNLQNLGTCEVGQVYATWNELMKLSEVLLDCAATSHMFFDKSFFTWYTAQLPGESITVGDGKHIPVTG
jgi:hypothetical protein